MKFELLCLTMPSRKEFLNRLIENLSPQLRGRTNVDMRIRMCDERYTLGENRNLLLRSARSEYVAFVDDDDLLADDYIETILPLLDRDYVGFDLQCSIDGVPLPCLTHHSLKFGNWYEDETGYYRDISHVNPIRRELAILEPFEGGHGEDKRWADRMRARGVLKTEHVISRRVMYSYLYRSDKNRAEPCPECRSQSTVKVEMGSFCNCCGVEFNRGLVRKSCLWI